MIEKKDIIAMARHVFKRSQSIPDKRLIHPGREWLIGITFFLVFIIVGGVFATRQFVVYQKVDVDIEGNATLPPKYKQTLIDGVLLDYGERKAEYDTFAESQSVILQEIDPAVVTEASSTELSIVESNDDLASSTVEDIDAASTTVSVEGSGVLLSQ